MTSTVQICYQDERLYGPHESTTSHILIFLLSKVTNGAGRAKTRRVINLSGNCCLKARCKKNKTTRGACYVHTSNVFSNRLRAYLLFSAGILSIQISKACRKAIRSTGGNCPICKMNEKMGGWKDTSLPLLLSAMISAPRTGLHYFVINLIVNTTVVSLVPQFGN